MSRTVCEVCQLTHACCCRSAVAHIRAPGRDDVIERAVKMSPWGHQRAAAMAVESCEALAFDQALQSHHTRGDPAQPFEVTIEGTVYLVTTELIVVARARPRPVPDPVPWIELPAATVPASRSQEAK